MEKICKICGESFIPIPANRVICDKEHYRKCCICGKDFMLNKQTAAKSQINRTYCYNKDCINKFKLNKIKQTNLEKYGVEYVSQIEEAKNKSKQSKLNKYGNENYNNSEKRIKTNLEKYGGSTPLFDKNIKEKFKETMIEKYGVKYSMQSKFILNKRNQTNLEKYGSLSPLGNKEIRIKSELTKLKKYGDSNYNNIEKAKQTNLEKYGVEYVSQIEEAKNKSKNTMLNNYGSVQTMLSNELKEKVSSTMQDKYGVPWYCMTDECRNLAKTISKINKKVSNLLKENDIDNELEFKINNYSYDIHILNTNILIEINPFPYHNVTWHPFNKTNPINYHFNKTNIAKENGYRCIHIFDWDDLDKIINMLRPKEKIFARKCKIKEVTKKETNNFLNKYHLQNHCNGNMINLGLYYNDELIQIMTFGKPRYNKNYEYELLRLCTKSNYFIIGGSEKLFKYFINNYKPNSIISYCDNSKFNGEVYNKLGFELKSYGKPGCHWYNNKTKKHITDNLLRQQGFDKLFNTNYGKGTSNKELMLKEGFVEIYDCGQSLWEWKYNRKL